MDKSAITFKGSSKFIWEDFLADETFDRKEVEEYIKKKKLKNQPLPNPEVAFLDKVVFPLLIEALIFMLKKLKEHDSFYCQKTVFDGLDFLCEFLYNKNPKYPKRQKNWTYIFDMDWVKIFLKYSPRPFYPFHLQWSRELAALILQSYMRGYWVRRRPEIQEIRQFWKNLKKQNKDEISIVDKNDSYCCDNNSPTLNAEFQ